ncbi:hypothetical protein HPP92_003010 [Vanilla planifolia]|uniref:Uncharacterized protein n=1 Tax=Vanilla planifolia TaxID=51239 RepID=A0A835SFT7_VANPL|nr:hypothetical protein HPP92_003010 [Vanilla planifolia]
MGRTEKARDAVNLLNFAGLRSLAELRGARADGIKNIDSISSLEPESKKRLKEAELPGYDVSVSFEGPKTLSVLKRKRGAEPQNRAMLVASNNRKEENEFDIVPIMETVKMIDYMDDLVLYINITYKFIQHLRMNISRHPLQKEEAEVLRPQRGHNKIKGHKEKIEGHDKGRRRGGRPRQATTNVKGHENYHYNARKMGRTEKARDAVNLLNFAGSRSLAELRGARADGIKNIDSISSLEPESKKCLKEAELPGYDVSVSFEGPKTLSVLKRKRGAEPQNRAILVASNNRKRRE